MEFRVTAASSSNVSDSSSRFSLFGHLLAASLMGARECVVLTLSCFSQN